jgi:hypothetical protein
MGDVSLTTLHDRFHPVTHFYDSVTTGIIQLIMSDQAPRLRPTLLYSAVLNRGAGWDSRILSRLVRG